MKASMSTVVVLSAMLAVPVLLAPVVAGAQTEGMERRDDRRGDRGDARDTRQTGRQDAREQKWDCKGSDASRAECRQEKRDTKQGARQDARDIKVND